MRARSLLLAGVTIFGAGAGANRLIRRRLKPGSVVLITGGSRGLGLAMAMEYARLGAKLVLCSRDLLELRIAEKKLLAFQTEVMIQPCDLSKPQQIQELIDAAVARFGKIDILVNNAGIMKVGPLEMFREDEFQEVVEINLWGVIRTILKGLPYLPAGSRIVNITSIGGTAAIPHLLPYTVSKFGALGFSLGLDAELVHRGISVTTVVPGLMRTGSFVNALFKGDYEKEFAWFSLGGTLPFTSISAESAARRIVQASLRRQRFLVLSPQAKALRVAYHLFPSLSLSLMRAVNRLLPGPHGSSADPAEPGRLHRSAFVRRGRATRLGDTAGDRLNENIV